MEQYNQKNTDADTPTENKNWRPPNLPQKDIAALKHTVEQQQMEIEELKRTVRRLQNEVRTAVQAFNARNHG